MRGARTIFIAEARWSVKAANRSVLSYHCVAAHSHFEKLLTLPQQLASVLLLSKPNPNTS
jgi:hypothetical protein